MSRILLSIAAVCVLLFPASGAMAAPAPDSGTAKVRLLRTSPPKRTAASLWCPSRWTAATALAPGSE